MGDSNVEVLFIVFQVRFTAAFCNHDGTIRFDICKDPNAQT